LCLRALDTVCEQRTEDRLRRQEGGDAPENAGGSAVVDSSIIRSKGQASASARGSLTVRYSNVSGNTHQYSGVADPTGLNGNQKANPLFVNEAAPSLRSTPAPVLGVKPGARTRR
jgi:hypothetical protein